MTKSEVELLQRIKDNDPDLKVVFFETEEHPRFELIKNLVDALNENKIVTSLCLNSSYIFDECCVELGRIKCPTLEELSLQNNYLTSKGVIEIAKIPGLKIINVSYNGIDDEGALVLSRLESLEKLYIDFNSIGNKGADALLKNKSIKKLKMEGNAFDEKGLESVFKNHTLFSFNARNNNVSKEYNQRAKDHVADNRKEQKRCTIL
jgi:hypothetical protein